MPGWRRCTATSPTSRSRCWASPATSSAAQEPGKAAEIASFCSTTYGVDFPMFDKVEVNGPDRHPLYAWLTSQKKGFLGSRGDQVELHQIPDRP
jgi:glutathione peroxidase-family protein